MKTFLLAFGLICVAIAGAFGILVVAGLEAKGAAPLAASLLAGLPQLKTAIDQSLRRSSSTDASPIRDFQGYVIRPWVAASYGAIMILGAMLFAAGVGGLAVKGMLSWKEAWRVIPFFGLIFVLPATFLVGRWIGRRVSEYGIIVVLVSVIVARTVGSVLDYFTLPASHQQITGSIDVGTALGIATVLLLGSVVLGICGLVGYWRGTRQRLSCYLNYLLKLVSPATRDAIVALAYDEAKAAETRDTR